MTLLATLSNHHLSSIRRLADFIHDIPPDLAGAWLALTFPSIIILTEWATATAISSTCAIQLNLIPICTCFAHVLSTGRASCADIRAFDTVSGTCEEIGRCVALAFSSNFIPLQINVRGVSGGVFADGAGAQILFTYLALIMAWLAFIHSLSARSFDMERLWHTDTLTRRVWLIVKIGIKRAAQTSCIIGAC